MEIFDPQHLEAVLRHLPDPAFVITRSGFYAAAFGGRDSRYYHDGSPLVGLYVHEFMQKEKADWLVSVVEQTLESGQLEVVEYSLSGKDLAKLEAVGPSEILWFEARIQALPFKVKGEETVLWVASNITERHRLEEGLKRLSSTDPLTGLFNRRHFEVLVQDELRQMVNSNQPVSALMFDVDHFKEINDTYGHIAGDRVLEEVGALITHNLRRVDVGARWGGEEFVIAMMGASLQQAMLAGERLRRTVEAHRFNDGISITVSIGVAECLPQDDCFGQTLERADAALYEAKRAGRNRVCRAGGPEQAAGEDLDQAAKRKTA